MDQTRAINSLAPFVALAKSATSPRAAADLVTQATSASNTYIFAELLRHTNIQALRESEQYSGHLALLETFAWGTWEGYKGSSGLPQLSDAQTTKLRLLSLLTIASEKSSSTSTRSNLSYASLCSRLDLTSPIDLEHLVTEAIYNDLITATLNPASKTVVVTSVAPLRDLAPGSVVSMIHELEAWSGRCDSVLADLESEISKIKASAEKRAKREMLAERQVKAVTEVPDKSAGGPLGSTTSGASSLGFRSHNARAKREPMDDQDFGDDAMDVDGGQHNGGGRKKSAGMLSRFGPGRSTG